MANITAAQMMPFIGVAGPVTTPLRTFTDVVGGARMFCGCGGGETGGFERIAGHAYEQGMPVSRRIVLLTQPPGSVVVAETDTDAQGNFQFLGLAPGTYMVIDCAPDNSKQALIYDWVVAG